jgi:hypothetical protein
MKVMATCMNCGREFLLDQLLEGPVLSGTCPWCDTILAPDYTGHLVETARRLEVAGSALEDALGRFRGGWARFRIDRRSVLGRLKDLLDEHEQARPPARGESRAAAGPRRRPRRFAHLEPPAQASDRERDVRRREATGAAGG